MKVTQKTAVESFLEKDDEVEPVAVAEETNEPSDPIDAMGRQFPGAPSRETIEGWKKVFGDVHAFVPDPTSLFLIRPLRRLEHKQIARDIRIFAEGPTGREDPSLVQDMLHERVVSACMLYPAPTQEFLTMSKAGLMPTLFNLVMENSKFLSQERALEVCYRL